ncbi:hypothetical protein SVIOM342S_01684 [Streptomyces violaceorubidus]
MSQHSSRPGTGRKLTLVVLGMTALSTTLLGLQSLLGIVGFGLGTALMMLLGNPLSGLATGPHWLPDGWATVGQLPPPGAAGSLLRANAFFDGTGTGYPALVLTAWVVLGCALTLIRTDAAGVPRCTAPRSSPPRTPAARPPPSSPRPSPRDAGRTGLPSGCVNALSAGTRAIAPRSWHSEQVGIHRPKGKPSRCVSHARMRLGRN